MVHTFCQLMVNIKVMLSFKNIKNGLSFMKPKKIEKKLVNIGILALYKKKMDSSTSTSETIENVSLGFDLRLVHLEYVATCSGSLIQ